MKFLFLSEKSSDSEHTQNSTLKTKGYLFENFKYEDFMNLEIILRINEINIVFFISILCLVIKYGK